MSTETQEQEQQTQAVQPAETVTPDTSILATPPQAKKNKLLPVIIGAALIVILALAGVGIYAYNTPANRLARLLDLGEKYLSELNYEQAVVAFQDALEIEPMCLPAYAGGIEAYTGLGDTDALQAFYLEAVEAMDAMEPETLNENIELAVEIFVQADEVFQDNVEKAVSVLEQGYEITDKNEQVADTLVDSYETLADNYREDEDYESELDIYDRILEVQPDNKDALHNRSQCMEEYLDYLISTGELDKAEELIERYRDVIDDMDFEEYTDQITTLKEQAAARESLLQRVYELMAAEDYVAMTEIDNSNEADAVVEVLNGAPGIYAPEGFTENYTGIAVGIYPYSDDDGPNYYFYYGDYVNGIREGHGILFSSDSTYYSYYDGAWQNDAPNGEGSNITYRRQSEQDEYGSYCISTFTGTFTDGLYDGEFTETLIDNYYYFGLAFSGTFTAVNGQVSDVWEQYPQYHHYNNFYSTDDHIICVVLENNTLDNWRNIIWWSTCSTGEPVSLTGFGE